MQWFPRLIGIVPLGIGLTVLGFLWGSPFGEFGSPPLFFRIFGSFVALGFVLMGGGIVFGAHGLTHPSGLARSMHELANSLRHQVPPGENSTSAPQVGYVCPSCGAKLAEGADVSPSGDAKCSYCKQWFNIHRTT